MKGVIVYADDDVLKGSLENKLYQKFLGNESYTIIPVTSISDLEEIVKSVTPIRVLLLDWQFKRGGDDEKKYGIDLGDETPENILFNAKFFSLVYIFSRESLPKDVKERLSTKYGSKIKFKSKPVNEENVDDLYSEISSDISLMEQNNDAMSIALEWSQRINIAQQTIFNELDAADPTWVKILSEAAREDTGDAITEVVNMYQELLSEQLRQDTVLRQKIVEYNPDEVGRNPQSIAKLYQRLIYSKVDREQDLMTGDICMLEGGKYAIVITPECEMRHRMDGMVDVLMLGDDFSELMPKKRGIQCPFGWFLKSKPKDQEKHRKIYNNVDGGWHILPSFPFHDGEYNKSALIDFKTAFCQLSFANAREHRIKYRLNAPYIHQLRQRFLAFFGRYGVSALPDILRDYNLTW